MNYLFFREQEQNMSNNIALITEFEDGIRLAYKDFLENLMKAER